MDIVLGFIFLTSALLLLSKKLTTNYMNWWLNQENKLFKILFFVCWIPISISLILWSTNLPAWRDTLWRVVLLLIGTIALIEVLIYLFFPSVIEQLLKSFMLLKYYFWAIPSAIFCLIVSLLLLI